MNAFWWALLSAGTWGFAPFIEKLGINGTTPLVGLFYRCVGVVLGVIILPLFFIHPSELKTIPLRSASLLMFGGFLASCVGQFCFYNSLKTGDISKIVPISGSYPFLTFLLGIFILNEHFTPVKLLGVILILTGIWILK